MFLVHRNRREGITNVHYLPDGAVLELPEGVLAARNGNYVIVQTNRDKFTIENSGSVNLTTSEIEVFPLEKILERADDPDALNILHQLEEMAFEEKMPEKVRRFVRLYAGLLGLELIDRAPKSYLETILLTVSRLTGESLAKLVGQREDIKKKLKDELSWTMKEMDPAMLAEAVNAVIAV
jgi:hypothetical protein